MKSHAATTRRVRYYLVLLAASTVLFNAMELLHHGIRPSALLIVKNPHGGDAASTAATTTNLGNSRLLAALNATIDAPNAARPHNHSSLIIPDDHQKADIVIFVHLYKTGGVHVRKFAESLKKKDNLMFTRLSRAEKLESYFSHLTNWLHNTSLPSYYQKNDNVVKTQFVELHPERVDQRFGLEQYFLPLQRLRQQVEAQPSPRRIFTFALVREPIDFYRSYFAFFHNHKCVFAWCAPPDERYQNMTARGLLAVAKPNHQTALLAGTDLKDIDDDDEKEEDLDMFNVFLNRLRETFDWIGTTEQLSTTTIPLLSNIMTNGTKLPNEPISHVGTVPKVNLSSFDDDDDDNRRHSTILDKLRKISQLDHMLYEWVQRTYQLSEDF